VERLKAYALFLAIGIVVRAIAGAVDAADAPISGGVFVTIAAFLFPPVFAALTWPLWKEDVILRVPLKDTNGTYLRDTDGLLQWGPMQLHWPSFLAKVGLVLLVSAVLAGFAAFVVWNAARQ
jgi:hypothetical protein